MYYSPTLCFVLFFLFSLISLACSSRIQELRLCETQFQCGNITAGFPFWGGNRLKHCGFPSLELHCSKNITSLFISSQEFYVLHLNQTSKTLKLARTDLLGSICNSMFTSTTLPPEIFELSPNYKRLTVFYYCFLLTHYVSSYKCPMRGFIFVSENHEYDKICGDTFTVIAPTSFVEGEKELNMTNLESVLSKGFEVKVKIDDTSCQECFSSHGSCGFNETLSLGAKCSPLNPTPPPPPTGPISVSGNPEDHETCFANFAANVPKSFVTKEKKLNITNLESVLEKGFEVNMNVIMKACQECSYSNESCGFDENFPFEVKCKPHHSPTAKFQCGNITAGFPFSGGIRPQICGHPSLELHCYNNVTSIIISDHFYNVLHIDQTSNTLRLARAELEGSFCNATYTATTLPSKIFEISSTYKSLTVFYLCDPKVSYRSSYACPGRGLVSVSQNPDYHNSCQDSFTINVPKSFVPEEKELNVTNLESALREGFEVKVKIDEKTCQKCSSSGGTCGFQNSTQICCKEASSLGCNKVHPLPDADGNHVLCSPSFTCGNQRGLLYPFWIAGRKECGHPDFELDCNAGVPELSISSVKFRILGADYDSGIITLARSDNIDDPCLPNSFTTSFNETVLPLASTTDLLTINYDCNRDFSSFVSTFVKELDCPDDDTDDRRNYYLTRNLPFLQREGNSALLNDFGKSCSRNVSIPASRTSLSTLESTPSTDNLKKALEDGFELEVNSDCRTCIDSKGACGFSQTSSSFVCYYLEAQAPQNPTRNKDTGLSPGAKAGIAVASVSGLAILILAGLFLYIRRRRKTQDAQYTSKSLPITSYSSRDTSRNPTSTTISSSSNHSLLPSISNLANGSDYCGVQVFSYEELEEATENFSRELGDGGFGTVYYGVLKDGRAVAVKRLYERSLKRVEQFKNEIEILKSLKHPNLVILYGCTSRHSRELLLVYEYISNGTLAEHLHGNRAEARPLCWSTRLNIAIETASALSFLHIKGIIHRDIKTTNILLDDNYQVKVADFGLSRLFPMDQTHISTAPQGTPGYVDPEYYQCYQLNEKSDVYSFGVVLTELISSKEAVDITRHRHDINLANMAVSKIQNNALHELVDSSLGFDNDPEVRRKMMAVSELAFRCLQQERDVRPAMDEIVEILRGIKDDEKKRVLVKSPDVVDIECGGGDDVGLLRNSVPPPISPETDKWTSSSDTAASL
ncbi:unnamed protein product [Arabidopsis thaliana]|uniref:non-specific serine/threonine protein kinase n=1 Tax=Arabidopsis thaliana TaxID=3702 RepID=A0A5S9WSC9_ARATH|nr:unnamed protein product [Arabidopsis thaliana]